MPKLVLDIILDYLPETDWWRIRLNSRIRLLMQQKITRKIENMREIFLDFRILEKFAKKGLVESFRTFFRKRFTPKCVIYFGVHKPALRKLLNHPYAANYEDFIVHDHIQISRELIEICKKDDVEALKKINYNVGDVARIALKKGVLKIIDYMQETYIILHLNTGGRKNVYKKYGHNIHSAIISHDAKTFKKLIKSGKFTNIFPSDTAAAIEIKNIEIITIILQNIDLFFQNWNMQFMAHDLFKKIAHLAPAGKTDFISCFDCGKYIWEH